MSKSAFTFLLATLTTFAASNPAIPAPSTDVSLAAQAGKETAVFAGGCFWGVQSVFQRVKGVVSTTAGYAGGAAKTATYNQVVTETTGHAESVEVVYDPSRITYGQLLRIYFSVAHDPTTLNRQHYDVGTQYRSAIFYANEEQKKLAEEYIRDLNNAHVFKNPIVTQVVPLTGFYNAEQDHQHFLDRYPTQGYIAAIDIPLLNNFREKYPEYYTKEIR